MNYQAFAKLYDLLMEEAPYDKWVNYVKTSLNQADLSRVKMLDIGCGTGELLVRLHKEGAEVTGVDLSSEMLTMAREKCEQDGFYPPLIEQSMTQLEGLDSFEVVTVFCDSLNYLETGEEVKETFKRIHNHLTKDGYLLFDVHSIHKIEDGFIGRTFADAFEDYAYIWTSFPGDVFASVEHEMTFFIDGHDHRYLKMEELHKQRTFSVEQYEKWLIETGFEVVTISADFTKDLPSESSERIFFCAQKKIIEE